MCERASNVGSEPSGDDRADPLRQAIERDYPLLIRRIGVLVYRICGRLRRDEIEDRVVEVLNEAVKRALQTAERFDPTRSATAYGYDAASQLTSVNGIRYSYDANGNRTTSGYSTGPGNRLLSDGTYN